MCAATALKDSLAAYRNLSFSDRAAFYSTVSYDICLTDDHLQSFLIETRITKDHGWKVTGDGPVSHLASSIKFYLASPFFNEKEIHYVEKAEQVLRGRGFEVFSPREHECRDEEPGSKLWAEKIFQGDLVTYDFDAMLAKPYKGALF